MKVRQKSPANKGGYSLKINSKEAHFNIRPYKPTISKFITVRNIQTGLTAMQKTSIAKLPGGTVLV